MSKPVQNVTKIVMTLNFFKCWKNDINSYKRRKKIFKAKKLFKITSNYSKYQTFSSTIVKNVQNIKKVIKITSKSEMSQKH